MKTSKSLSAKMKNIFVLSIVCSSALFMASCKKEEFKQPLAAFNTSYAMKQTDSREPFDMVKIDHIAAMTDLPDYSVTVNSDGLVTFQGRKNVAYADRIQFSISPSLKFALYELFKQSSFYSLGETGQLPPLCGAQNATSFNDGSHGEKTLYDFNTGYPQGLVQLRIKAEKMLDISKYVNIKRDYSAETTQSPSL